VITLDNVGGRHAGDLFVFSFWLSLKKIKRQIQKIARMAASHKTFACKMHSLSLGNYWQLKHRRISMTTM